MDTPAPKWHRVDEGYGITSYEYRDSAGTALAIVYQGGKSGYRWTAAPKGQRSIDTTTLASAKSYVEGKLAQRA